MPYKGSGKLPGNQSGKNKPLADQLTGDKLAQGKGRTKKRERQPEEDDFMTDAMSNKVMLAARQQLEEVEAGSDDDGGGGGGGPVARPTLGRSLIQATIHEDSDEDDDDEDDPMGAGRDGQTVRARGAFDDDDATADDDRAGPKGAQEDYYEDIEISPEDEKALSAFMAPKASKERTLADIILEKIKEKERADRGEGGGGGDDEAMAVPEGIDQKVVDVYRQVGDLLKRYTVGKIPKAFKIIPALSNWEEVLYLTNPDKWSPHAMFQATRLFASNLNAKMAQRFYSLVLLPRVRDDIAEHKRLHFALYQALKKATFKPAAFYKGILIPLCASRTCTLREAVVLSSVLTRGSIPMLHSAAALLKLAELPYAGTTSFFLRVLLDKKYALPFRVVDALVDHFLRFRKESRQLPVVWHQSLLCFVQRYKQEIRAEDKLLLRKLVEAQHHYQIGPEVKRELNVGRSRGENEGQGAMDTDEQNGGKKKAVFGGFAAGVKQVKAVQESVRDMPEVRMMDDDDY